MSVLQQVVLVLNLLVTGVFGVACFVAESKSAKPRTKARLGVLLGVLFFAFLSLLLLLAVLSALLRWDARYLFLAVYVIIPFVIGRLASYRTLRFYTALQVLALLLSALTLCVISLSE